MNRERVSVVCADERSTAGPEFVPLDVGRWKSLAELVLAAESVTGELTVTFVDEADIAELNAEHMGKTGPTDVLSFPLDEQCVPGVPTLLGDVVISPGVAAAQCADHAGTFDDEIALLIVHGILHVLGHDHADPDDAVVMRTRELELLRVHHWAGTVPARFRQTHE